MSGRTTIPNSSQDTLGGVADDLRRFRVFGKPWRVLHGLLLALAIALIVRTWLWSPVLLQGASMLPTLRDGEIGGINKLAYRLSEPRRGDIVVISAGGLLLTKRIVGLPGEEITLSNGVFYINGDPLPEPYVKFSNSVCVASGRLRPGCYVVVGDNRAATLLLVIRRVQIVGRLQTLRLTVARE